MTLAVGQLGLGAVRFSPGVAQGYDVYGPWPIGGAGALGRCPRRRGLALLASFGPSGSWQVRVLTFGRDFQHKCSISNPQPAVPTLHKTRKSMKLRRYALTGVF